MFDDARPERLQQKIWVAAYDTQRLVCARCFEEVLFRDVAFFTRTRPGDPFDPWCHVCAHTLVKWAGAGALATDAMDDQEAANQMRKLLADGR